MRIIAGEYKGRRLKQPRGAHLRPTSERVREALFSIIGERLQGARFLDLCAGTGAVGMEALSRGAQSVVFVESHAASLKLIQENLRQCGLTSHARIIPDPADAYLQGSKGEQALPPFDIVFADPPYQESIAEKLLTLLGDSTKISANTLVILEHSKHISIPAQIGRLTQTRQYRYGDTMLTVFQALQSGRFASCA